MRNKVWEQKRHDVGVKTTGGKNKRSTLCWPTQRAAFWDTPRFVAKQGEKDVKDFQSVFLTFGSGVTVPG